MFTLLGREPLAGNGRYPASSALWVLGPELCIINSLFSELTVMDN